jgi:hypothetical protein
LCEASLKPPRQWCQHTRSPMESVFQTAGESTSRSSRGGGHGVSLRCESYLTYVTRTRTRTRTRTPRCSPLATSALSNRTSLRYPAQDTTSSILYTTGETSSPTCHRNLSPLQTSQSRSFVLHVSPRQPDPFIKQALKRSLKQTTRRVSPGKPTVYQSRPDHS